MRYRKVADGGSSDAQVRIAGLLVGAKGPNSDYSEALQRCQKAAKANYPPADVCLGVLYQRGLGVATDYTQAVRWFDRGADRGNPLAMLYLGQAYWKGNGVSTNKTTAYMWLLLASSFSLPEANAEEARLRQEISANEADKARQHAREWTNRHRGLVITRR
jgi:TPR repeat protein